MCIYTYRRNPADRAGLDKALVGENLEYKFLKQGYAWTVVILFMYISSSFFNDRYFHYI